ncbi:hypothetical protein OBBRIDRAFT_730607 [Obba rivulosa]|uniref:Protein kinase domain-containing protein n=1 Tax=Obba rivulosa TaxID=1052685 RepID=A0A8E2DKJ8_9APHY|nr:hypothetical protein OBBRIDRAFT_730607 [Obba rivulosa]
MFIGRPLDLTGPPVSIYHAVFARFKALVANPETEISSKDLEKTSGFIADSAVIYSSGPERASCIYTSLSKLLGRPVEPYDNGEYRVDSAVIMRSALGQVLALISELKNEYGSGGCDPDVQADFVYRKWWSSRLAIKLRKACCCPSFTVSIAGPHLTVHGAVFADRFIVQPLMETLWLANDPDLNGRVCTIARGVLCALRTCLDDLENFYRNLRYPDGDDDPDVNNISPYFQSYSTGEREVKLNYTGNNMIGGQTGQALFEAVIDGNADDRVMVKFVRTYNVEAHSLLAQMNLAPRLRHFQRLGDGLSVVVMDRVPGQSLVDVPTRSQRVLKDIERAMEALHAHGLVFGDLRQPNIVLCQRPKEENIGAFDDVAGEWDQGAMLVDFDWCGKHGEGRYPPCLNTDDIQWHPGVKRGGIMLFEHDVYLFEQLQDSIAA